MLNQKTKDYIQQHLRDDVRELALRGCNDTEVDMSLALTQISGKQVAIKKIPSWAANADILYPQHLSLEQCSSEPTACYKEDIIKRLGVNGSFVDLTGGMGVDFSFMARSFKRATYVERQTYLCDISSVNFPLLGIPNAEVINGDGIEYLKQMEHVSMIYIDPARRDNSGARTFAIADCTPNVIEHKDLLLSKADYIIVKLSPMLDWRKAVADMGDEVGEVHIVSTDNECKELLLVISKRFTSLQQLFIRDISTSGGFALHYHPQEATVQYPESITLQERISLLDADTDNTIYLYEPGAAVMKAGCFGELSQMYGVQQIDKNSHLFVSREKKDDFPGRRFVIDIVSTMNKKEIKEKLHGITKANIAVRNFPLSPKDLGRRLKISDGGNIFIFATTIADRTHIILVCSKI